jgi:hypothetical protein
VEKRYLAATQLGGRDVGGARLSRHSPAMMRPGLFALAMLVFGCQRNHTTTDEESGAAKPSAVAPAPAVPPAPMAVPSSANGDWKATPLGRDLERICNVLTYAGVVGKTANEQLDAIVEWLPSNIESEDGRTFLGSIAELGWGPKADALDAAAGKVGLTSCPLAAEWRKI